MFNAKLQFRDTIEIILLVVIALLSTMLITGTPSLKIMGIFILPIPITIAYLKYGFKLPLAILIFTSIFNAVSVHNSNWMFSLTICGITGIVLGILIKKQKKPVDVVYILIFTSFITIIINIILYLIVSKVSFVSLVDSYVKSYISKIDYLREAYISMGIPQKRLESFEVMRKMVTSKNIIILIPLMITFTAIFSSIINYILTRRILKKFKNRIINVPEPFIFNKIYVSNLIGAFLIGTILIGGILDLKGISIGQYIGYSSFAVAELIFIINGIAAFSYYLRVKKGKSKTLVLVIIFIIFLLGAERGFFYIGFMEMLLDFRRLDPFSLTTKKTGV